MEELTGAGGEHGRRGRGPGKQRVKTDHIFSVGQQRLQGDGSGVGGQGALRQLRCRLTCSQEKQPE